MLVTVMISQVWLMVELFAAVEFDAVFVSWPRKANPNVNPSSFNFQTKPHVKQNQILEQDENERHELPILVGWSWYLNMRGSENVSDPCSGSFRIWTD